MWTVKQAWEWYDQQPWIVGFNYVPSTAVNSTQMWQKEDFDAALVERELRAAADIGFNACRVFMQYLLWRDRKTEFFEVFDAFLTIAARCGIRVMPILFDDCRFASKEPYLGVQEEPTPGLHNGCWTPSPGPALADDEGEQPNLRAYVTEFVSRYAKDGRILLWDLYNEPSNCRPLGERKKSLTLVRNAFAWARACAPMQPLTACAWMLDSNEAENREVDRVCLELSDIVSFHDYCPLPRTLKSLEILEGYGRPLLCSEWLHRPRRNTLESHLPIYKEKRVAVFNWGMVAGKTQTYLDWDRSKNPTEGMPALWQHDILRTDLTPYRSEEVAFLSETIKA